MLLWFNMFPVSVIIIALCEKRGRRSSNVTRGTAACYCHYRGNSNILFHTHSGSMLQHASLEYCWAIMDKCSSIFLFASLHLGWHEICRPGKTLVCFQLIIPCSVLNMHSKLYLEKERGSLKISKS